MNILKSFIGDTISVNMDQVRKFRRLTDGFEVTYLDGDVERFNESNWAEKEFIEALKESWARYELVPASSGFEIISFWLPEGADPVIGNVKTWRSPVIAWRINHNALWDDGLGYDNTAIAIDDTSDREFVAVVCPNGYVRANNQHSFENVDQWLEWAFNEWKERQSKPNITVIDGGKT
jgi:hypothetical protein